MGKVQITLELRNSSDKLLRLKIIGRLERGVARPDWSHSRM